ncbi:MAG: trypsin-like peptidase domain-containing protein [Anaerolineae bacterium]|nr:trypsin-like peptidase domain-containing protein [Anaerolineae bacterium]
MPFRTLQLGIDAIQAGSAHEGARLIRIALKHDELPADMKAIALMWLAETEANPTGKRNYYTQAVAADPNNADARARLMRLMSPGSVTAPAQQAAATAQPAAPQAGRSINLAEHVASVVGGARGAGSGFFVSQDGLIATTRRVAGAKERLTVDLHDGRQLIGLVVRAYPELDLTLIQIDAAPPFLMPIVPEPRVADEAALYAFHYTGEAVRGSQRPTRRVLAVHWIPTTIKQLKDEGGGPLIDERGMLAGMITKNTSQTSEYYYALSIQAIRACVENYQAALASGTRRSYCPACGASSIAGGQGYFYCETCGGTLPAAMHISRYPIPQAAVLYETSTTRCTKCASAAGIYQSKCLRCGQGQY